VRRRCLALGGCLALLAVGLNGFVRSPFASAHTYVKGHDNSTNPIHDGHWDHGDPNAGEFGSEDGLHGYYYLSISTTGSDPANTYAWCEVYSPGEWLIEIDPAGSTTPLISGTFHASGGRVFWGPVATGTKLSCRIANLNGSGGIQKDYAEFNSGSPNDANSDCGGPGVVLDPNTGSAPVEPPESINVGPAVPNHCQSPTAVQGTASVPISRTYIFFPAIIGQAYKVRTYATGDLTAIDIHTHNTAGVMTITDLHGHLLHGVTWGHPDPNPETTYNGFTAADAGVQPPGTYLVTYSKPPGYTVHERDCLGALLVNGAGPAAAPPPLRFLGAYPGPAAGPLLPVNAAPMATSTSC
jgi:hypothetical protein